MSFRICLVFLLWRLEQMGNDVDSGATATVMFLRSDVLIISHLGDSCVVFSYSFLSIPTKHHCKLILWEMASIKALCKFLNGWILKKYFIDSKWITNVGSIPYWKGWSINQSPSTLWEQQSLSWGSQAD